MALNLCIVPTISTYAVIYICRHTILTLTFYTYKIVQHWKENLVATKGSKAKNLLSEIASNSWEHFILMVPFENYVENKRVRVRESLEC